MKQDRSLDPVDRRIVALLQEDATLSHAQIAERVGAPDQDARGSGVAWKNREAGRSEGGGPQRECDVQYPDAKSCR